jgi:gag-polypeptide of LTR copia-type
MAKRDKPIKLPTLDTNQYRRWADTAKQTFEIFKVFDVVDGSSPDPTPPNVDSDNPNSPTFLALPPNQRKTITDWKYRHLLAREAITSALSPEDYNSVGHLKYASEIWTQLRQEYGQTFDIRRAVADTEFHALKKLKSMPMEDHIRKFKKLRAELDYQRPTGVLPMERALVNLAFLTSLITGEDETEDTIWRNFHTALGDNVSTMPTEQLFARVRAHDTSRIRSTSQAIPSTSTDVQAMTAFAPKSQFKKFKRKNYHPYR